MSESQENKTAGLTRIRRGTVSSTGGQKTIRVDIEHLQKHPQYGKYIRRRTRLAVHDPHEVAKLGDIVEIVPCRRISKNKSWRLVRVVRAGATVTGVAGKE
ncbi:MAG: 30S ribosomal protein S17 [Planctomycetota bacterium]